MFSGVLLVSIIIIFFVIGITVLVTVKAYSVTRSETIDPLPPEQGEDQQDD